MIQRKMTCTHGLPPEQKRPSTIMPTSEGMGSPSHTEKPCLVGHITRPVNCVHCRHCCMSTLSMDELPSHYENAILILHSCFAGAEVFFTVYTKPGGWFCHQQWYLRCFPSRFIWSRTDSARKKVCPLCFCTRYM